MGRRGVFLICETGGPVLSFEPVVMQQTEALSHGRVRLAPGTLYGALNSMSEKGWIEQLPVEDGSRKKEYCLTERGREVLLGEVERLRELLKNGETVLGGQNNE